MEYAFFILLALWSYGLAKSAFPNRRSHVEEFMRSIDTELSR